MSVTVKTSISGTSRNNVFELRTEITSSELGMMTILRPVTALNDAHAKGLLRKQLSDFARELAKAIDRPSPDSAGA
jgi:hypothetical protein